MALQEVIATGADRFNKQGSLFPVLIPDEHCSIDNVLIQKASAAALLDMKRESAA